MSETSPENPESPANGNGIPDDQLPEDVRPGEDNPLAEPLPVDEQEEGLVAPEARAEPETESDD